MKMRKYLNILNCDIKDVDIFAELKSSMKNIFFWDVTPCGSYKNHMA
jgi:hypothetical protein